MRLIAFAPLLASLATALPSTSVALAKIVQRSVASAPPEAKAVLKSVSTSGTGCASNTAEFVLKDDASLFFDSLFVDTASTAPNKRCLVTIDLQLDPKWKYLINKASQIRGYVDNASASFKAVYTVNGANSEITTDIKPSATKDGNFLIRLQQAGATSAPGGGVSTIDISLTLTRDSSTDGLVAVDSLDIGFTYST